MRTNKNVEDFYPLSPMQQGMLFHSLYAPDSGVYVEQLSCTLQGDLNVQAFERAWQQVMNRNPILRSGFVGGGLKEPVQVVHRDVPMSLESQDWRALPSSEVETRLESYLRGERERGFDLSTPPLMRLALMQVAQDAYQFVWSYHHILLDGWSVPILLQEVFVLYEALCRGEAASLHRRRPYRDYIVWLKNQRMDAAEAFWREQLRGFTAPTPLTVDHPLEQGADQRGVELHQADDQEAYDEQEIWLSRQETRALERMAREHHLTINTLIQGAWALLLSRYSGEDDVLFGATVSGRPTDLPGAQSMIGLFINTLPIRVQVSETSTIDWLRNLQARVGEIRDYEYSPLIEIQGWSDVPRGVPLFESILVFENYPIDTETLEEHGGLSLSMQNLRSFEQTNYPLTLVAGAAEQLMVKIVYDVRRFEEDTISRMLGHLRTLLESLSANPSRSVWKLPLLTETERHQMLVEWHQTTEDYPSDRCVHELIEEQANQTPRDVAVVFEDEHLTYEALSRQTNQLAHYLQKRDVGPETIVAICLDRSLEMIVALLGVLKAGGAYLPLDPTNPEDRLAFMLKDSQASLVLTKAHLSEHISRFAPSTCPAVSLDADWEHITKQPGQDPGSAVTPDNLAYVIYTSGSTGRPKGTLLEHRGLCNLTLAAKQDWCIARDSRVLQFFSFGFDGSILEIFPALLAGAALYLVRRETLLSAADLRWLLQERAITVLTMTPSVLRALSADGLPALRTVVSGGEACTGEIPRRWAPGRRFFNAYGPTETTVAASWHRVEEVLDDATSIPIGRPMANTRLYLLDQHGGPVPVGVPGELHVSGVGVARGYLNRPGLTAERFIPDPFSPNPGTRMYRTGDLARYLPDGTVEFLARIDDQVKVRGFRIELGEIEAVLGQHPAVQRAVAVVREDTPGNQRLVSYVVPTDGQNTSALVSELRSSAKAKLPNYMVPSAIQVLDTLPLTPSNKVDYQALPAPGGTRQELETPFVRPRDALELELARIWEEILEVEPVGVEDDFFALGGHSLLAIRLIGQMERRLGTAVPMVDLFQNPTVAHLASVIRKAEGGMPAQTLVPIQPKGTKRPLFFIHPSGGSVHWYADLGRHLRPDQPLYGIQAQGLNGNHKLHTRIEDMAAHYVAAVRDVQPEGPYLLGSWSMGVIVAFEMAQQLHAQNQEVGFLAMLDQGPYHPTEEPEDDAAYLADVFGGHLSLSVDHLRTLDRDGQITHVWEEARKAKWIYPEVTLSQFHHFVRILRIQTEAWRRYEPQPYSGPITLFRARNQDEDSPQQPDMGWAQVALGGVEIHEVPGDHLSMIHKPHVRTLAKKLRVCLEGIHATE